MVENTFNVSGVALPVNLDPQKKLPLRVRIGYAYKALTNAVHTVGPIDVSKVKTDGYMEGRVRVYLTPHEIEEYHVFFASADDPKPAAIPEETVPDDPQ